MAIQSTGAGAQTQRQGLDGGLWLLLGVAVLVAYGVDRQPPGTLQEALLARPALFLWAAGVLLVPLGSLGVLDWRRALARDYRAPSVRVQLARSALYGACAMGATLSLLLFWEPLVLRRLAGLGGKAAFLFGALPFYGLAVWWLCFKGRTFVSPALPSFREASSALRDTYDFVLGRAELCKKDGPKDPRWFIVPEFGMYANLYCLGGIGSGKTHCVAKPMLEQALFKFPGQREVTYEGRLVSTEKLKVGALLFDLKGDNADELVIPRAQAAGRGFDVIVLRPGGEWKINPLAGDNPQALAQQLVAALTVMTSQQPHSFYLKMQLEFATNAIALLTEVLGAGCFTLLDLYEFIVDPTVHEKYVEAAKPKNSLAYRWFANQWAAEEPRSRLELIKGFRADLSQFVTDELSPTFCSVDSNFPGWDSILNEGRVVVFSMSQAEWGPLARALGIFFLMQFQNRVLARTTSKFKAAGGNTERLVMVFLDEAWAYMNPKLAEFTSVSRQARCCTVALHQSLDQVPLEYRGTMIGNFRTPIILGINDPLSLDTFSKLFGTHKEMRASRSESTGFSGVEQRLLTDKLLARAGGESRSVSTSETEVDVPRFTPDDIQRLPKFQAIVQLYDGDVVRPPEVVSLIPGQEALLA